MTRELFNVLEALCGMWNQYCDGECGHMCMSAGEDCETVLDSYGLLKNCHAYGGDIDYERLETLRSQIVD